jgi:hypothetical protein
MIIGVAIKPIELPANESFGKASSMVASKYFGATHSGFSKRTFTIGK